MKICVVFILLVLADVTYGQVPKGWRIPAPVDIKGQWSEGHWDKECQQLRDVRKKSANDAVEYTANSAIDKAKDASKLEEVECWKPESFPVHTATGDYNGDGVVDDGSLSSHNVGAGWDPSALDPEAAR